MAPTLTASGVFGAPHARCMGPGVGLSVEGRTMMGFEQGDRVRYKTGEGPWAKGTEGTIAVFFVKGGIEHAMISWELGYAIKTFPAQLYRIEKIARHNPPSTT